ncbi:unnamed protein product [Heterobilharzia americana]|nr:unnamed protein product [Heterobilharzia americana]
MTVINVVYYASFYEFFIVERNQLTEQKSLFESHSVYWDVRHILYFLANKRRKMADEDTKNNVEGCCRYSTSKAGMEGLDKATIMEIILENSKGSKYYENELRRERTLRQQWNRS